MNKQVKYKINLRIKHIDDEDFIPYFDMDDLQLSIRKMLPDGFVGAVGKTVGNVKQLNWYLFTKKQLEEEAVFFCEIDRDSQIHKESNGMINRYFVYDICVGYETKVFSGGFKLWEKMDAVTIVIAKMIEDKYVVKKSSLSLRELYRTRPRQSLSIPIGKLTVDYERHMVCGDGYYRWKDSYATSNNNDLSQSLFTIIPFSQISHYHFYCDCVTNRDWDSQDCDGREHADMFGETMYVDGHCEELPTQAESVDKSLWDNVRFDLFYYLDGERMKGVPETNLSVLHYSQKDAFEAREKLKPLFKILRNKQSSKTE